MDDDQAPQTEPIAVQPEPSSWVLAGRYLVRDRIGSGGMAEVFRACDQLLNRDVAVKVFRTPVDEPGNSSSVARRELELQALAQLSHPNLITLFDASLAQGETAFLVMELVDGPNLAARLREGALPEPQARVLGEQVADALAYVHARGMVHRDVKPANILLGTDGSATEPDGMRARLSDFGIVRMIDDARLTAVAFTLGTASYLSPEQALGANVDPAADVYSLGLVLIEVLTGVRSFDGPQHEAVAARLVRSPDIPPNLPGPWPQLLAAMTARDPTARPSAADVANSLRGGAQPVRALGVDLPTAVVVGAGPVAGSADADAIVPADPFGVPDELPPEKPRGAGVLVAAALLFLAVIVTSGFLFLRSGSHQAAPGVGEPTGTPTHATHRSARPATRSPARPTGALPAVSVKTHSAPSARSSGTSRPGRARSSSSSQRPSSSARASSSAAASSSASSSAAASSSAPASSSAAAGSGSSTGKAGATSSAPASSTSAGLAP